MLIEGHNYSVSIEIIPNTSLSSLYLFCLYFRGCHDISDFVLGLNISLWRPFFATKLRLLLWGFSLSIQSDVPNISRRIKAIAERVQFLNNSVSIEIVDVTLCEFNCNSGSLLICRTSLFSVAFQNINKTGGNS